MTEDMKIKANETISVEEGLHNGVIQELHRRKEEYDYLDVVVTVDKVTKNDGQPLTLTYGVPFNLSAVSKLGKLLEAFGHKVVSGKEYDIANILKKGIAVKYQTINETTDKGTFARIVVGSLKPTN